MGQARPVRVRGPGIDRAEPAGVSRVVGKHHFEFIHSLVVECY